MLNTTIITARDILRNYRRVFDQVKKTKRPVVIVSQKEPQVAIIPLDDLERLKALKNKQSTKALLDMAGIIPKGSGLPKDLSDKHDAYTWD
ncbi:type II toxin-antitoxin system Phd/YefM family antitoxin [Candidatus Daviesbacteria bacterium]|nr:type II toxin-antitoxin system Phd/YefM family antitoxin [Candidatus Daviesbacteria bacterium]